jgi:ATP-dependent DNA helicase RecQ
MVYFLVKRPLRDQDLGPTLLVSPLLALMCNQLDAVNRLGLRALTDSTNSDAWATSIAQLLRNDADLLFISPERLSNEGFRRGVLGRIYIGLFVVDEAHCISD